MKYGVREICDVVLRAKATMQVGNKVFYKDEPVIYFDSLKTTSLEGASTTVYATGGKGNTRLLAWEGERTLTFTMEDALISPVSFMILSGAGLVEAGANETVYVHTTETTKDVTVENGVVTILLEKEPYDPSGEQSIYVMLIDETGDKGSEPYIATRYLNGDKNGKFAVQIKVIPDGNDEDDVVDYTPSISAFTTGLTVFVDYYVAMVSGAQQIEISGDSFGGNFYLEASTLFRRQHDGIDEAAEFIIPNCKIQSNFTFSMASSGDPSTFTFTMDAFPGELRFRPGKKVLAAIQIVDHEAATSEYGEKRIATPWDHKVGV